MTGLSRSRKTLAFGELLVAGALWGFGYIAVKWALPAYGPFTITALRFVFALALALPLLWYLKGGLFFRTSFFLSAWPGLFLAGTLIFQTWGLVYTTATKSGFITILYAVMVPLLEAALRYRAVRLQHFLYVGLALLGALLMAELDIGDFNFGDLLTLIGALLAAAQIVAVSRLAPRIDSSFTFNVYQCFWAATPCLILMFLVAEPLPTWEQALQPYPFWGMMALTLGSTVIAFHLQIRAQRLLSASVSSLLFLLESPFAMLFAFWLLAEEITWLRALGAALIFVAAMRAILSDSPRPPHASTAPPPDPKL